MGRCVLAAILLAGAGLEPLRALTPAPQETPPAAYGLTCPVAGAAEAGVKGVCRASFQPQDVPPNQIAAAYGRRDGVIVVAVSGAPLAQVFATTDGGVHWQSVGPPKDLAPVVGPGEALTTGRVALAFDARGAIHLIGELYRTSAIASSSSVNSDLYHFSSSDLGATWSRFVMLGTKGAGAFPALTAEKDRLFVTWGYRGNYRLHVARSLDGGASWSEAQQAPTDCINASQVAVLHDVPYVACATYANGDRGDAELAQGRNPLSGLRIYRVDEQMAFHLEASIPSLKGVWPHLFAASDEALVLLTDVYLVHADPSKGWDKCCAAVTRGTNRGRSWSAPIDLRRVLHGDDGWTTFRSRAAGLDQWGRLHVIVDGGHQADPGNGHLGTDARLVYAAIDPVSGQVLGESPLTPAVDGPQGYFPGSAALAPERTFGLLLWRLGGGVNYSSFRAALRR